MGVHSVGKTTLVNQLKKHINLPVIPEAAREIISEIGKHPTQMTKRELLHFEREILERQIQRQKQYSTAGFLSDRTTLDILSYCYMLGLHIYYPEDFKKIYLDAIRNLNYDYVFFVKIHKNLPLVDDGIRYKCESCRYLLERVMIELLRKCINRERIFFIYELDLSKRVEFVLDKIKIKGV